MISLLCWVSIGYFKSFLKLFISNNNVFYFDKTKKLLVLLFLIISTEIIIQLCKSDWIDIKKYPVWNLN